jgi:putative sporulation protein YyaC
MMVASENVFKGSKLSGIKTKEELIIAMVSVIPSNLINDDVVFLCIGTDRSTGDSLAPMIGTYLKEFGYKNVYGTLDEPVHAMNLAETLDKLPKDKKVIAIDACLGLLSSVGTYQMINGSLKPGAGVNRELPETGDYSIVGIVNVGGFMEFHVLQNTRLSLVVKMAKDITSAIMEVFPLEPVNVDYTYNKISDEKLNKVEVKRDGIKSAAN